jgi:hypothetical protein
MVDLINYRTQLFQSIADTARYFRCNEETIRRKLKGISIKRIPLLNDYILLFYADDYYNA